MQNTKHLSISYATSINLETTDRGIAQVNGYSDALFYVNGNDYTDWCFADPSASPQASNNETYQM